MTTIAGGGTLYLGDLNLQLSSGAGASKISFKKTAPCKLYLEVNSAGAITNCYGDLLSSNGNTPNPALTCSALGGTMSGNTCHLSTPAETCADLGGTVSNGACRRPASTPTAPPPVLGHWVTYGSVMNTDHMHQTAASVGYPQCAAGPFNAGQVCSPVGTNCIFNDGEGQWIRLDCK